MIFVPGAVEGESGSSSLLEIVWEFVSVPESLCVCVCVCVCVRVCVNLCEFVCV